MNLKSARQATSITPETTLCLFVKDGKLLLGIKQRKIDEINNLEWFPIENLPRELLWPSDLLWIDKVLAGHFAIVAFVQDYQYHLVDSEVSII